MNIHIYKRKNKSVAEMLKQCIEERRLLDVKIKRLIETKKGIKENIKRLRG